MDSIIVKGGNKLEGTINISGAKNAALPIMAASLLTDEKLHLTNIPKLVDIRTMQELLTNHGSICASENNNITIDSSNITNYKSPYDIVRKMRASIWTLGPLLARFGEAEVSMPGGCAIGARMIDQHLAVMKAFGAKIKTKNGYILAKSDSRLKGCHFNFTKLSVGATINGILAATLAEGETILTNCASEPEIVDLIIILNKMGASIEGAGTSKLVIKGVKELGGANHHLIGDRIEAGTFMCAVGVCGGKINLKNIDYNIIENIILKLTEAGMEFEKHEDGSITVTSKGKIKGTDMQTEAYPGFATDLQAQFMTMMTIAEGSSAIAENIFENRFMHVPELCRMGANITIDGHNAFIRGVPELSGAEVMASDLRASSSLIIAGLAAKGETKVRRIYHLDRGYEDIEAKLRNCGAEIERIKGDTV